MRSCTYDEHRAYRVKEITPEMQNGLRITGHTLVPGCGAVTPPHDCSAAVFVQRDQDAFSALYERSAESATSPVFRTAEPEMFTQMEHEYGDLRRLNVAANVIQKAFRSHVLNKSFLDLRNRQRSVSDVPCSPDEGGTLTPHRVAEWCDDATLRATRVRSNASSSSDSLRMRVQISPSCVSSLNDGAQLKQAGTVPYWSRQPETPDSFKFDGAELEADDEELSLQLRSLGHSETSRQSSESAEQDSAIGERLSSADSASLTCRDCEQCQLARQVAQLSLDFGIHSDRNKCLSSSSMQRAVSVSQHSSSATASMRTAAAKRPEIDKTQRRLYRVGINLFNRQPEAGVRFCVAAGFVKDEPRAIAHFLLARKGLSRCSIGEFLGAALRNEAIGEVLAAVTAEHRFAERPIDVALRLFQTSFQLTGEAQRIQRVVEAFAAEYTRQNDLLLRTAFHTPAPKRADLVQLVALACLMLNTDLHSPSVRAERKMKPDEFVRNLSGLDDGQDLERQALLDMYDRVRAEPFTTAPDHLVHVRKLETLLIGLADARALSQAALDLRQRRKSNSAIGKAVVKPSDELHDSRAYRFESNRLATSCRRITLFCQTFEVPESHVRKLFASGAMQLQLGDAGRLRLCTAQTLMKADEECKESQTDSQKRDVFVFNDSVLISKQNVRSKRKSTDKARTSSYTLRQFVSLLNAYVTPYASSQVPFGVCLVAPACDVFCGKNGSEVFTTNVGSTVDERPRTLVWQDSSSTGSSHSNLSSSNGLEGHQNVAVLAFSTKNAVEQQKLCSDLVESIVETRTVRRVLACLADGMQPADVAHLYVAPQARVGVETHANLSARRVSEPVIAPAKGMQTAKHHKTHAPVLSVSSTSSSSIGTLPSNMSIEEMYNSLPRNCSVRSATQRQTVAVDGSRQTLLVTPEKAAHVLSAADVHHLLRTSLHHAPSTPSPLARNPLEQEARRLQLSRRTCAIATHSADIDCSVAENSDYLTFGGLPVTRR